MAKADQGRPKSKDCSGCLTSAFLPNMNVLALVIGVLEPENRQSRSRHYDLFAKIKVAYTL